MKKIKIAIIGCGTIANNAHIPAYLKNDKAEICYFCDIIPERAEAAAKKYGCGKAVTDYHEILNDPEIEAVSVCTPNNVHATISIDCMKAGKHVLCEKSAARTYAEALEMQKVQHETGMTLNIGVVNRFNDNVNLIKKTIDEGKLGDIYHVYISFCAYRSIPGLGGAFTTNAISGGGALIDWGVHYIDVMQWFADSPVTEVSGFSTSLESDTDTENYGMIQLRLKNGCIGYYEAGWGKNIAAQNLKEFIGDKGRISLTLMENRTENREEGDLITVYKNDTGEYKTINVQSVYKDMYAQMKNLVDMIENGTPANPDIDAVMSAFNVALTAVEAIKEKKVLEVKNPFIPTRNLSVLRTAEI